MAENLKLALFRMALLKGEESFLVLKPTSKEVAEKLLHESIQAWKVHPLGAESTISDDRFTPVVFVIPVENSTPYAAEVAFKKREDMSDPIEGPTLWELTTEYGVVYGVKLGGDVTINLVRTDVWDENLKSVFLSEFEM
jgi:hypothetical protein